MAWGLGFRCVAGVTKDPVRVKGYGAVTAYISKTLHGSFRKIRGTLFWGPYNKDPMIQGAISGCP